MHGDENRLRARWTDRADRRAGRSLRPRLHGDEGYDGEPEATARAIDGEGWLHTGDLGVMREDGYIHLTGRAKDMIIRGGENVYPREVEEFLYTHPKVAEVQVVGIPDE